MTTPFGPSGTDSKKMGPARTMLVRPIHLVPILLAAIAALAGGCRTVEPWERGALAAARMQDEPHGPHADFVDHVRRSREAASAGSGSSGAGCGCY